LNENKITDFGEQVFENLSSLNILMIDKNKNTQEPVLNGLKALAPSQEKVKSALRPFFLTTVLIHSPNLSLIFLTVY
jgi:hypothetical protein